MAPMTPPNLLYLAIYNPLLDPPASCAPDDEDAEEQAHILFYTSRDRAASRDKMLRQVGLAKALVSFSELFSSDHAFDNAHSQTKRLVSISPEPDFWIHAGIELARTPRASASKEKSKTRPDDKSRGVNAQDKGKGKRSREDVDTRVSFDFIEGSIHDLALRADLLRAYEMFKLTHGTFSSILDSLGREALELQLERFFTVWAWTWNLEDGHDFGKHLGIPLHPLSQILIPDLDEWCAKASNDAAALLIVHPYVVPSTKYTQHGYPASLCQHLLSVAPANASSSSRPARQMPIPLFDPPPTPTSRAPNRDSQEASDSSQVSDTTQRTQPPGQKTSGTFLGVPTMNLNVNMNIRTWAWPEYMSFGKAASKKSPNLTTAATIPIAKNDSTRDDLYADGKGGSETPENDLQRKRLTVDVDELSLKDTVASNDIRTEGAVCIPDGANSTSRPHEAPNQPPLPPPPFSSLKVYLGDKASERKKVFYITKHSLLFAIVGLESCADDLPTKAVELLDMLQKLIQAETTKSEVDSSLSKLLQPQDKYVVSTYPFTTSNAEFTSTSEHLFNAQKIQESDPDVLEVFSRGQHPQHWHVARRSVGHDRKASPSNEEVFLEIARKETSLIDVDNILTGVVKTCMRE